MNHEINEEAQKIRTKDEAFQKELEHLRSQHQKALEACNKNYEQKKFMIE